MPAPLPGLMEPPLPGLIEPPVPGLPVTPPGLSTLPPAEQATPTAKLLPTNTAKAGRSAELSKDIFIEGPYLRRTGDQCQNARRTRASVYPCIEKLHAWHPVRQREPATWNRSRIDVRQCKHVIWNRFLPRFWTHRATAQRARDRSQNATGGTPRAAERRFFTAPGARRTCTKKQAPLLGRRGACTYREAYGLTNERTRANLQPL